MSAVARVQDYNHLRKVNGAVINVDSAAYTRAKIAQKNAGRLTKVERDVADISDKLDQVMLMIGKFMEQQK